MVLYFAIFVVFFIPLYYYQCTALQYMVHLVPLYTVLVPLPQYGIARDPAPHLPFARAATGPSSRILIHDTTVAGRVPTRQSYHHGVATLYAITRLLQSL